MGYIISIYQGIEQEEESEKEKILHFALDYLVIQIQLDGCESAASRSDCND